MRMCNRLFLVLLFLALHGQLATPVSRETCTVEGTVFAASSGAPLARAEVLIRKSDMSSSAVAATTDGNGHYVTENIEPGRYFVTAQHQAYVPQMYGQSKRNHEGTTLLLESGMKLHAIDFRLFHTGVISGKVLEESGEVVPGATINALRPGYIEGERRPVSGAPPTQTNDLGEYRIYNLVPDRYYVAVSGEDPDRTVINRTKNAAPDERYVPTLYPSVSDIDHATLIDVPPGREVQGIDIVVSKSRTFHIRGEIAGFDATDQYNRVQLQSAGSWEISARASESAPDRQGKFQFTGVTPGSYTISATLFGKDKFLTGSRLVQVQDSDLDNVKLVPSDGVLRGQLRADGPSKGDLGKLRVRLVGSLPSDATVLTDGSFMFRGIDQSRYRIDKVGAEDFYIKSVRIAGQELTDGVLDLSGDQQPSGILQVVLAPGGRIDGVVTEENDAASNSVVVLVPELRDRHVSARFKNTTTDQNGQFALRGIAPGKYKLFAWDDIEPGIWWNPEFLSHYEHEGEEVTIEESAHVSARLHLISISREVP
jgi:hypothetical protein